MGLGLAANDLRVSLDVGCYRHSVAIGLSDGQVLDEFDVDHTSRGIAKFFSKVEGHRSQQGGGVAVATEGYNGQARPLDRLIQESNYRLYNVNNLKLARYKEIFPAPAKSDCIDTRKSLELFTLCDLLPAARGVLQEVVPVCRPNQEIKILSRRRQALVEDKSKLGSIISSCMIDTRHVLVPVNRMQANLQAASPGMVQITRQVERVWFLNFLTSRRDLRKLSKMRKKSVLDIPRIGKKYASVICQWQQEACFSGDVDLLGPMIIEDAERIIFLRAKIKEIERHLLELQAHSDMARRLGSLSGYGVTGISVLTGEIGNVERFANDGSLAVYLGMAPLTKESGKLKSARGTKHINRAAKKIMMTCVDRHRKQVSQSQRYYEKKLAEGKSHNQAIRALGRHLSRVIYRMLKDDKDYDTRS